jgi:hypothetical protein
MFAINHAATALLLKKRFDSAPMVWLLISVQLVELLWVLLNYLGIEQTTTEQAVRYVGDIHLSFMPYSHSVVTMIGIGVLAWLVIAYGFKKPVIGTAVGLGIVSHLVLDLLTHTQDMPLTVGEGSVKLGIGLYSTFPAGAFVFETAYGVFCWWVYKGSRRLLATILVFNLANLSMFFTGIAGPETLLAGKPMLITSLILGQIIITLALVGHFSRKRSPAASAVGRS